MKFIIVSCLAIFALVLSEGKESAIPGNGAGFDGGYGGGQGVGLNGAGPEYDGSVEQSGSFGENGGHICHKKNFDWLKQNVIPYDIIDYTNYDGSGDQLPEQAQAYSFGYGGQAEYSSGENDTPFDYNAQQEQSDVYGKLGWASDSVAQTRQQGNAVQDLNGSEEIDIRSNFKAQQDPSDQYLNDNIEVSSSDSVHQFAQQEQAINWDEEQANSWDEYVNDNLEGSSNNSADQFSQQEANNLDQYVNDNFLGSESDSVDKFSQQEQANSSDEYVNDNFLGSESDSVDQFPQQEAKSLDQYVNDNSNNRINLTAF